MISLLGAAPPTLLHFSEKMGKHYKVYTYSNNQAHKCVQHVFNLHEFINSSINVLHAMQKLEVQYM